MREGAVRDVPLKAEASTEMLFFILLLDLCLSDRVFISALLWKRDLALTIKVSRYILPLNQENPVNLAQGTTILLMEERYSLVSLICELQRITEYLLIQSLENFLYSNTCRRNTSNACISLLAYNPFSCSLHSLSSLEFFLKLNYPWLLLYLFIEEIEVIHFNFSVTLYI